MKHRESTWHDILHEKYEHLFSKHFWGFEVPDVWEHALTLFLEKVDYDYKHNNCFITLDQIKEKFGSLRIYYSYVGEDPIESSLPEENIAYATAIVDHTCQKCGKMYPTTQLKFTSGWLFLMCKECNPNLFKV